MSDLARKLMREDEREQYDAYVAMGTIDVEAMLDELEMRAESDTHE